jgi:hypothetical protein
MLRSNTETLKALAHSFSPPAFVLDTAPAVKDILTQKKELSKILDQIRATQTTGLNKLVHWRKAGDSCNVPTLLDSARKMTRNITTSITNIEVRISNVASTFKRAHHDLSTEYTHWDPSSAGHGAVRSKFHRTIGWLYYRFRSSAADIMSQLIHILEHAVTPSFNALGIRLSGLREPVQDAHAKLGEMRTRYLQTAKTKGNGACVPLEAVDIGTLKELKKAF